MKSTAKLKLVSSQQIRGQARLNELDRDEFRDATRPLWPTGYTADDFNRDWTEFQEMKRRRAMQ